MSKLRWLVGLVWIANASLGLSAEFRFDHAIIAVRDLATATRTFEKLGFNVEPGRLHADRLDNAHIKFQNGSAIELMSVAGAAERPLARQYAEFLKAGEGGAFIAISAPPVESVVPLLRSNSIKHTVVKGRLWDYITFARFSELGHFFLIHYHQHDEGSILHNPHENGAERIDRLVVDGGPDVRLLLKLLGAKRRELTETDRGDSLEVYRLHSSDFILAKPSREKRPRWRGMGASSEIQEQSAKTSVHGIEIELLARRFEH